MKKISVQSNRNPKNVTRMQVFRMARIVSLLKQNRYPSAERLLHEYEKLEYEENLLIRPTYNVRTVYRDVDSLKNDFHCPIAYSQARKGYYLTDHTWEFNCPAQLSESALFALILGARVAEDVFPDPLRGRIRYAVDEILKGNNPDFLDTALLHSLKVFAESGAVRDSKVFPTVFEAWQRHRQLRILYDDMKGDAPLERVVEPHALFLYAREWRIKAYCHLRKAPRTFVISRIVKAEMLEASFVPDVEIINSVTLDRIVAWKKYPDVKIRLTGDVRKFAASCRMHSRQTLTENPDGSWLFSIPEVPEQVVVPWILSQRGDAVPLSPPEIVEAVRTAGRAILKKLEMEE